MSHFAVMVIGNNIEDQLAPYHEFECTGEDNQYVRDIDETEEAHELYHKHTVRRFKDSEGNLLYPYDDKFYRDPTAEESLREGGLFGSGGGNGLSWDSRDWGDGRGYRPKIHVVPDDVEDIWIPSSEVMSFRDFIEYYYNYDSVLPGELPDIKDEHKYGYYVVDGSGKVVSVIRRTNPDAKWDWWVIGGRYTGFFKPKEGRPGIIGKPGAFGNLPERGWVDQIKKGDVDFDGMRDSVVEDAIQYWNQFHRIIDGREVPRWSEIREKHNGNIQDARNEFNNHPVIAEIIDKLKDWDLFNETWSPAYFPDQNDYIEFRRNAVTVPYAYVMDREWHGRGDMGWFGMSDDKVEYGAWAAHVNELLDNLPDDTLLTLVDCHI